MLRGDGDSVKWIDAKERKPGPDEWYVYAVCRLSRDFETRQLVTVKYVGRGYPNELLPSDATHWLPIPEPPDPKRIYDPKETKRQALDEGKVADIVYEGVPDDDGRPKRKTRRRGKKPEAGFGKAHEWGEQDIDSFGFPPHHMVDENGKRLDERCDSPLCELCER